MVWPFSQKRQSDELQPSADAPREEPAATIGPSVAATHVNANAPSDIPTGTAVWAVVASSVRGASHVKDDKPNQDALCWRSITASGSRVIVALADGHGSSRFFRSQTGSQFAVSVATTLLEQFLRELPSPFDASLCKRAAETHLPEMIVQAWREAVDKHLAHNPFHQDELAAVEQADGPAQRDRVIRKPISAYGTTLLAIAIHELFILGVHIGDGEIMAVMGNGDVTSIVKDDPSNFANETASLSSDEPQGLFRVAYHHLAGRPPVALMLTTDGYVNAFESSAFPGVLREWVIGLRDDGVERMQQCMPSLLSDASARGSGDDCTVAFAYRSGSDFSLWPTGPAQDHPETAAAPSDTDGDHPRSPSDSDIEPVF